jgi:hypothetical protein
MFSYVLNMDWRPDHSSLVALVRPFLNMDILLYTLRCGRHSFHIVLKVSDGFLPRVTVSAHKNPITAHRSFLVHTELGAAMLALLRRHYNCSVKVESISQSRREFVLLPALKINSAANTARFKINHCGKFLAPLDMTLCETKTRMLLHDHYFKTLN